MTSIDHDSEPDDAPTLRMSRDAGVHERDTIERVFTELESALRDSGALRVTVAADLGHQVARRLRDAHHALAARGTPPSAATRQSDVTVLGGLLLGGLLGDGNVSEQCVLRAIELGPKRAGDLLEIAFDASRGLILNADDLCARIEQWRAAFENPCDAITTEVRWDAITTEVSHSG